MKKARKTKRIQRKKLGGKEGDGGGGGRGVGGSDRP